MSKQVPVYVANEEGRPVYSRHVPSSYSPAEIAGRTLPRPRKDNLWRSARRFKDGWFAFVFEASEDQIKIWDSRPKSNTTQNMEFAHG